MKRVLNFSAGPSAIALSVLQEAAENLVSYKGLGFSVMEISHRGKVLRRSTTRRSSLSKRLTI